MTWRAHSERIAWRSKAAPLAVAVAAIVACQLDHVGRQSFGILAAPRIRSFSSYLRPFRRWGHQPGGDRMTSNASSVRGQRPLCRP